MIFGSSRDGRFPERATSYTMTPVFKAEEGIYSQCIAINDQSQVAIGKC